MKYTVTLALLAALLAGCAEDEGYPVLAKALPEGLSDCTIYYVKADGISMYVMRCPNSSVTTTHQLGKAMASNTVISN